MERPSLANPDEYYARRPNPRFKTNGNNRSTFTFGDDRDWNFDTIHQMHYRVPVKIPPRHESIMPGAAGAANCTKAELDRAYVNALNKVGVAGVKRLELAIRTKIEQRTAGGPMALRKAFKYFDSDASGDIDPDEFFSAMHAFGLEFTEDQVLALFGYYDVDRDGGLSYYEFIEKVMDSGFGNEGGAKKELVSVSASHPEEAEVEMKSVLTLEDMSLEQTRQIFKKFDANNSGEIDMRELGILVKALGLNMGQDEINHAMIDLDKDQNGSISFEEFWSWFQSAAVVKHGKSSPMKLGSVKVKSALRREVDSKMAEDADAELASIARGPRGRPTTATPSRSSSKVGSWVSRQSPGMLARPQTAMERGSS